MNSKLTDRGGRLRRRTSVRRGDLLVSPAAAADGIVSLDSVRFPAETPECGASVASIPHGVEPLPVSPGVLLAFAREAYNIRRKRARFLPADLFGEPTWDILLDLYVATREKRPVPTTSACIGAHVPPTTALRWLRILEARGLVEREEDGCDGRRTFVRLSEQGLAAIEEWLQVALTSLNLAVGPLMRRIGAPVVPMAEAAE